MDISVALGSGGVKGFAHIGVLRYLETHGFRVRAVAGSSIGGLVGAVYALGITPDEMEDRVAAIDQKAFFKRRSGDGPSIMGLEGVLQGVEAVVGERTFSDLRIPFACTAVELETGQPWVLNRGRIIDAIQSTIAVPGLFPPHLWEGRLMVDGAVLDPVPVGLARSLAPGLPVVAVNLSPLEFGWKVDASHFPLLDSVPFIDRIYQHRYAQSLFIFMRAADIVLRQIAETNLEREHPEVVIRPIVEDINIIGPVDVHEVARYGELATEQVLSGLQSLSGWRRKLSNRLLWLSDYLLQESDHAG